MSIRSLGVVAAIGLGLSISSQSSEAATLTLAPGQPGDLANSWG